MCSGAGVRGSCNSDELLAEVNRLVDFLAAEEICEQPADAMQGDLLQLRRIGNRIEAEFSRRLRHLDRGRGYTSSGALSASAWLHHECNMNFGVASHRVEVARQLESLPATAEAFAAGTISHQHVSHITRTAEQLGELMEPSMDSLLARTATQADPKSLRRACIVLRHQVQAERVLLETNQDYQGRRVHLSETLDGMFRLDGWLDPEGGATMQTALDSLMGPPASDDHRDPSQRRADALVEMGRQLLDRGRLPEVAGQKPHLIVTVELDTLRNQPGSPAAELEWAQPIPAETARRLACDAVLTPVVDGLPGVTTRVVPGAMRRALVARDKGCRHRGCDRPAAWTDAHHLKHWADGGPTSMENLVLLCRRHHRMVHEQQRERELAAVPP